MNDVAEVEIGNGVFKYILIKLTSKSVGSDGKLKTKTIVRGYDWAEYHADILDRVAPKFHELGLTYECIGGGRIEHDKDAQTIQVYGYSVSFGQANHKLTCSLLASVYDYPEGNISWRNSGFHSIRTEQLHEISGPAYTYANCPDQPIQLVRPDGVEHRKLEIIDANVKCLHRIDSAVAVIAVVGKFHSGKSFLLNQLMGKREGFGIGPSVRPQTMGIWMWGQPLQVTLSSGMSLSVIFLDTEGFAANNISESYDAKIFSVATLLSSYLIYNSVKIIDQADIDYLELLSRRTQLFALRSQITKSQWFDEFNHDLLKFPPLVWVVQDFFQATENNETPRQWLHKILESNSRESSNYDISLLGIFDSIDCHTLFLPATKKDLLQDLSKATEDDLTPEYKAERDSLLHLLMNNLIPKEKNGKAISGPELSVLLEILVTAANEGSIAEIPGRWEVFVSELRVGALEDCITFYDSDMKLLQRLKNDDAVNETELENWHYSASMKAQNLLEMLLFGLESVLSQTLDEFAQIIEEKYELIKILNDKKIQLKCSEAQRRSEIYVEELLQDIILPVASKKLRELNADFTQKGVRLYSSLVSHLSDHPAHINYLKLLKDSLRLLFNSVELKNTVEFEKLLEKAVTLSLGKFRDSSENYRNIPWTSANFQVVMQSSVSDAKKVFEDSTLLCHNESIYQVYCGLLEAKLREETDTRKLENFKRVEESCNLKASDLVDKFRHNTGNSKIILPIDDKELEIRLESEKVVIENEYSLAMKDYEDTPPYRTVRDYLAGEIAGVIGQRREENYQAYIREVEIPLKTAKKLILLSADRYDTEFSVKQYMVEVCMLNLDEGKAKEWQESLKLKISLKFITDSSELQDIIASKKGFWSSLKGFFEWLVWCLVYQSCMA